MAWVAPIFLIACYRNYKKEFFKDLLLLANVKSEHNHDSGIYHSLEGVR